LCIGSLELHRARSLIDRLRPHATRMAAWGFDLGHLEDLADVVCGGAGQVLQRQRSRPQQQAWLRAWALINARRHAEAKRELARLENAADARDRQHAMPLRCLLALDQGRFNDIDSMLREIAPAQRSPLLERTLAECGLRAALARGQGDRARAALHLLDADGTSTAYLLDRTRLALIDGDQRQAAGCFAALQALGPASMVDHLISQAPDLRPEIVRRLRSAPPVTVAKTTVAAPGSDGALVGTSPVMAELRRLIQVCAPLPQPVLLVGETGTGKEIAARELHRLSPRSDAPFMVLNCAGLTDSLAEAELFGHLRGAFTGAVSDAAGLIQAAGRGTIFLDEIDSLAPRMQGLLLRLLESGDYLPVGSATPRQAACRFICACHGPLDSDGFRSDLRYRLERLVITLPPLRERREDIPVLCRHFLQRLDGSQILQVDDATLARFQTADWPGNVRELRNAVERLALLGQTGPIIRTPAPPARQLKGERVAQPSRIPGPPQARQRRARILALFDELSEVYPADAIAAVACAANTATADLRALESVGLIRRERRSGHARMNPYVRA
jgi:DNA-binding NtrC family response regulator